MTVRIAPELIEAVTVAAEKRGTTRIELVRSALLVVVDPDVVEERRQQLLAEEIMAAMDRERLAFRSRATACGTR